MKKSIARSKSLIFVDPKSAKAQIKTLKSELNKARNEINKLKRREAVNFYAGVISAIAVVNSYGEDSIVDAIVLTCDEEQLITAARANGDMRWSGLDQYLRRKR